MLRAAVCMSALAATASAIAYDSQQAAGVSPALRGCLHQCRETPGCNYAQQSAGACVFRNMNLSPEGLSSSLSPEQDMVRVRRVAHPRVRAAAKTAATPAKTPQRPAKKNPTPPAAACIYRHQAPPTKLPAIMYPLYHHHPIAYTSHNGTDVCAEKVFLQVAKGCRAVTAVINTASGPPAAGSPQEKGLLACMHVLGRHGVRMVGYIHTKQATMDPATGIWHVSGMRNMADIKRDVTTWVQRYGRVPGFRGIFVDETTNYHQTIKMEYGIDHIKFYREVITFIKRSLPKAIVILNPGSFVHLDLLRPGPNFTEPADISVPYENYAWRWRPAGDDCGLSQWTRDFDTWGPGPWCPYVPVADHIEDFKNAVDTGKITAAAVIHSCANFEWAKNEAKVAQAAKFRYFYATDRTLLSDPWDGIPSFWDTYLTYLNLYGA